MLLDCSPDARQDCRAARGDPRLPGRGAEPRRHAAEEGAEPRRGGKAHRTGGPADDAQLRWD